MKICYGGGRIVKTVLFLFFSSCFSGERFLELPIGSCVSEENIAIGVDCIVDQCLQNKDIETVIALRTVNRLFHCQVCYSENHKKIYQSIADHSIANYIKRDSKLFCYVIKNMFPHDKFLLFRTKLWNLITYFFSKPHTEFFQESDFLQQCGQNIFTKNVGKIGFSSFFDSVSEEKGGMMNTKETIFGSFAYSLLCSNYFSQHNPLCDMVWKLFSLCHSEDMQKYILYIKLPDEIIKEEMVGDKDRRNFCQTYVSHIATIVSNKTGTLLLHIDDPYDNGKQNATTQSLLLYFMSLLRSQCPAMQFDIFHNVRSINFNGFFLYLLVNLLEKSQEECDEKITLFKHAIRLLSHFKGCKGFSKLEELLLMYIPLWFRDDQTLKVELIKYVNQHL